MTIPGLTQSDFEVVRETPLFSGLTDESVTDILKGARLKKYERGEMLFLRGDPVDRFFVLLEGWIKVFRDTPDGDQSVVAVMKPGDGFAQAAIFTGRPTFPASAEIVDDARLVEIPSGPFLSRLKEDSELSLKMLGAVSERMLQLVQHIEQLQFRSTSERLADFLVGLAEQDEGPATIRLPYDKSLIAARLGMKPESLSRALAKLRKLGVSSKSNLVEVEDLERLREFCRPDDMED